MADKLDESDLVDMVNGTNTRDSEPDAESDPVAFTANVVREGLELGRKLGNPFVQNDSNVERALLFQRNINKCFTRYEEVYKDLAKNQTQLFTDFFTRVERSEIASYLPDGDSELYQVLWIGESDIVVNRKKKEDFMKVTST